MTNDSIPSFDDMLDVLGRNPLKAIQLAGKAHRGVNQRSYEVAGIVCGFARVLIDDDKHRADFYDEEFFDGLKRFHPSKLLLHVFAYVYGALSGPSYNRASEHARALKEVCDDRDIDVAEIPKHVADHGGFDGLLSEREDQEDDESDVVVEAPASVLNGDRTSGDRIMRNATANAPAVTSNGDDGDDRGADDEEVIALPTRGASSLVKSSNAAAGAPPKRRLPQTTMAKVFEHLLVAMEPYELTRFLADASEVGDTYRIMVVRDANDADGMLVWRAVDIGRVHDKV